MRLSLSTLAIAILVSVGACDDHSALPPPAIETAATTEATPCEASIDAIGWQCADGHTFSARHDMNDACVVAFEGEHSYVLRRTADGGAYSHGTVTLTQSGDFASLTGTETGPHENCPSASMDE